MGFRSMFVSDDYPIFWPQEFKDKYGGSINFPKTDDGKGGISSHHECKTYGIWIDLAEDIQGVLRHEENKGFNDLTLSLVFLHECKGITKVEITKEKVVYGEPTGFEVKEDITHHYCYGCSDLSKIPVE